MRLIEADKAKEVLKHQLYETAMNSIKSMVDVSPYKQIGIDMSPIYEDIAENRIDTWVNLVPTVDAEPVVRCKDCKHYYALNEVRGNCSEYNFVEKIPIDYCSWAERKKDE